MGVMRTNTFPPIYYYSDEEVSVAEFQPNQVFRILASEASTNASLVKGAAGGMGSVTGFNTASTPYFLKVYNQNTVPNVGTDKPFWVYYVPSQSDFGVSFALPLNLTNGIAVAFTAGVADTDNTPVGEGDIMTFMLVFY